MRALGLFAIGLIFGGLAGFLIAASQGVTLDGHDHGDPVQQGAAAEHTDHDITREIADPTGLSLTMTVTKDPVAGHNLHLTSLRGFRFTPENSGLENVAGEGHAHVYINGVKFARLYGSWLHIPALPKGENEILLTLNANDHATLTLDGAPVSLTQIVTVD